MWTEAAAHLRTVRDLLRFAVSRFEEAGLAFGHGTDNAYDEAAYLILHALHLPPDRLEPFLDAALLPSEMHDALNLLKRRALERLPAAYLTREAWLGELRFHVDERVIVPRSHLAELIRDGFSDWIERSAVHEALDLCTGCGCLAILLAHTFLSAHVDAVDISNDALDVAHRNVGEYGLSERIALAQGDLFEPLAARSYDLIVGNPPYVPQPAMEQLPAEYRHEPPLALAGGVDGLDVVRRILAGARRSLRPGGWLAVEIGEGREALEQAFPRTPFIWPETARGGGEVFLLSQDLLPA